MQPGSLSTEIIFDRVKREWFFVMGNVKHGPYFHHEYMDEVMQSMRNKEADLRDSMKESW